MGFSRGLAGMVTVWLISGLVTICHDVFDISFSLVQGEPQQTACVCSVHRGDSERPFLPKGWTT